MALRAIAAGDSLACRAVVPPELGDLRQLAFDAAIERAGRRDQRRRIAGLIGEVDPVARSVLVRWPFGELTAGRWRVQVRASSLSGVSTFVLDEELAVEPSMLPARTRMVLVRLVLPPMRLRAEGQGAPVRAVAVLRLPPMRLLAFGLGASLGVAELRLRPLRLSAQGQGALHVATVRLGLAPMRLAAQGSGRTVAEAVLVLAPLRATAVGSGLRPQATATLRLPGLRLEARGYGHIGTGVATLRLPRMRLTATGPGGPTSTLLGWEDDAPLLGWADDAPLLGWEDDAP